MTGYVKGKRYWLVGASEGLGRALAHELAQAGADLVLSRPQRGSSQGPCGGAARWRGIAPCDVSDTDSVRAAFAQAGDIDGLIYMAAVYDPMSATEWDAAKVETMCDVNFTGAARVLGLIVPYMTGRDAGHIVLIGSLAGGRGLPGAVGYGASKAGLISLAETMRADLDPERIRVQIVNPGFIKTRLTDKNDFRMPFLMTPEDAARRTLKAMESGRFRHAYPRRLAAILWAVNRLPDWLYFRLVS